MDVFERFMEHFLLIVTMRTKKAAIHNGIFLREAFGKRIHLVVLRFLRGREPRQEKKCDCETASISEY